ncbi:MAG: hypothetical protein WKG32_03905 [Gemmatimonadaceae bacterium]
MTLRDASPAPYAPRAFPMLLGFFLALHALQAPDSIYATPALRAAVARAAEANRAVPAALARYRAHAESEMALLAHRGEGDEGAVQLEQVASTVHWARDGSYEQHVTGYRAQTAGFGPATISYFRGAWTVPVLYGNRLALLFGARDSVRGRRDPGRRGERSIIRQVVHPFATDRDVVYAYTGGDTVATLALADRSIRVARIHVEPRRAPDAQTLVFQGDVDIDAERYHIVRMRGRFVAVGGKRSLGLSLLRTMLEGVAYVELENAEVRGAFWLPSYQRIELQVTTPLTASRSIFRIISRFRDYALDDEAGATTSPVAAADTLALRPHRLTLATPDSLAAYDTWLRANGAESAASNARDFDDVAPPAHRTTGPPHAELRARRFADLVHYNRVEGLYTGLAGTLALRDAAPGVTLRADAGWAWTERTPRGGVEASLVRPGWLTTARAERTLAHTNDFTPKFDAGAAFALFGRDEYDYVDRRLATLSVARELGQRADARGRAHTILRAGSGVGSDHALARLVRSAPIGRDTFRANRPVEAGRYVRSAASIELRPEVSGEYLQPGVGALLRYERGDGGLRWQRAEARLVARRAVGHVTLAARADAGALLGPGRPPQHFFELGEEQGLPGYSYKAFAGDRAALARGVLTYDLGVLHAPVRIGRRLYLPGVSPAPSVGIHAGWTGATARGRAAFDALNAPLVLAANGAPPWRTTDGVRATVDVRLRFFGGAVSVGLARAIDHSARWRSVVQVGGGL